MSKSAVAIRARYKSFGGCQPVLFGNSPAHEAVEVNTGTREQEARALRWNWEVPVPELETRVFIAPGSQVKNREERLIVLNDVAKSVIEARRAIAAVNRIDASRETPAITVLRRTVEPDESCESLAEVQRASASRP